MQLWKSPFSWGPVMWQVRTGSDLTMTALLVPGKDDPLRAKARVRESWARSAEEKGQDMRSWGALTQHLALQAQWSLNSGFQTRCANRGHTWLISPPPEAWELHLVSVTQIKLNLQVLRTASHAEEAAVRSQEKRACVRAQLCLTLSGPLDYSPPDSAHGIFQARPTGVGLHFFLQGIFPTQGLNPRLWCLQNCKQILYQLGLSGKPSREATQSNKKKKSLNIFSRRDFVYKFEQSC